MATDQKCVDNHIFSLHMLNQTTVSCTIGPDTVEFDYIKCNKCKEPFHHITYAFACEKNKDYYLCFKCYPCPKELTNQQSVVSWLLNTNNNRTQIFAKTVEPNLDLHKLQTDTLVKDDTFVDIKIFKYNVVFTTYLYEYFHFLATNELPSNPIDKRDLDI